MRAIVQLERIGDLVQSLEALDAAARHPEPSVLLVQERVAAWAGILAPRAVRVLAVPTPSLRRLVAAAREGAGSEAAREAAARLAGELALPPLSQVVNLTWHATGQALATALRGEERAGPFISESGRTEFHGFWSAYPVIAVEARPLGRVHMTDVRRLLVRAAVGTGARPARATRPESLRTRGSIALVVAAGDEVRVPSAGLLGPVATCLAQRGADVILVGGPADVAHGREVARVAGAAVRNVVGQLGPRELVELLETVGLVIGPDTGPVHLASHLGAPVVMLMSGRAHVWETGPVRPGDIALQALPVGDAPASAITADAVLCAAACLTEGSPAPPSTSACEVHRAARADGADPLGGVVYDGSAGDAWLARTLLARFAGERVRDDSVKAGALVSETLPTLEAAREMASRARRAFEAARDGVLLDASAAATAAGALVDCLVSTRDTAPLGSAIRVLVEAWSDTGSFDAAANLAALMGRCEDALSVVHRSSCARDPAISGAS